MGSLSVIHEILCQGESFDQIPLTLDVSIPAGFETFRRLARISFMIFFTSYSSYSTR